MAIEKRRMQQRYGTYEQFRSDLQNILDHEFISVDSGDTTLEGTTKGLYFKFPGGNPVRIYTTNEIENYNNKFNYYSVSNGGDLNSIKNTGFYNFAGVDGYSNIPDGQTSKIKGTLLVVNHKFTTSTDVWNIDQYWFSPTNEVFARTYSYNEQFSSGSWSSWILIATDINNIVEDINIKLNKKENISNKTSNIQFPSIDSYPNTKAVWDYVEGKLTQPLSDITDLQNRTTTLESKSTAFNTRITDMEAGKENASNKKQTIDASSVFYPSNIAVKNYVANELIEPKAEIESLKSNKLDKTDFNTYKTATDKAVADNTKSIKANTTAIDKCVTDIASNSALINKNAIKVTTDKSTSVVLNDSSDCNIVDLICGKKDNSKQIAFYRKNLFDFNSIGVYGNDSVSDIVVNKDNKSISFTTSETSAYSRVYIMHNNYMEFKGYGIDYTKLSGKPVALSFDIQSDINCKIGMQFIQFSYNYFDITPTKQRIVVTDTVDINKLNETLCFYTNKTKANITISNIQIEVNNTATDYEDCDCQKVTLANADVNSLHTYYPSTTVIADSDVQLSYVADTKHYIDNKFNELATAIVAHESGVN